ILRELFEPVRTRQRRTQSFTIPLVQTAVEAQRRLSVVTNARLEALGIRLHAPPPVQGSCLARRYEKRGNTAHPCVRPSAQAADSSTVRYFARSDQRTLRVTRCCPGATGCPPTTRTSSTLPSAG